jgi:hypothetical protein
VHSPSGTLLRPSSSPLYLPSTLITIPIRLMTLGLVAPVCIQARILGR